MLLRWKISSTANEVTRKRAMIQFKEGLTFISRGGLEDVHAQPTVFLMTPGLYTACIERGERVKKGRKTRWWPFFYGHESVTKANKREGGGFWIPIFPFLGRLRVERLERRVISVRMTTPVLEKGVSNCNDGTDLDTVLWRRICTSGAKG